MRPHGRRREWRDYAIDDWLKDVAVFSIFKRASDNPVFHREAAELQAKQGAFAVLGQAGQVLKRGHDLSPSSATPS